MENSRERESEKKWERGKNAMKLTTPKACKHAIFLPFKCPALFSSHYWIVFCVFRVHGERKKWPYTSHIYQWEKVAVNALFLCCAHHLNLHRSTHTLTPEACSAVCWFARKSFVMDNINSVLMTCLTSWNENFSPFFFARTRYKIFLQLIL